MYLTEDCRRKTERIPAGIVEIPVTATRPVKIISPSSGQRRASTSVTKGQVLNIKRFCEEGRRSLQVDRKQPKHLVGLPRF